MSEYGTYAGCNECKNFIAEASIDSAKTSGLCVLLKTRVAGSNWCKQFHAKALVERNVDE